MRFEKSFLNQVERVDLALQPATDPQPGQQIQIISVQLQELAQRRPAPGARLVQKQLKVRGRRAIHGLRTPRDRHGKARIPPLVIRMIVCPWRLWSNTIRSGKLMSGPRLTAAVHEGARRCSSNSTDRGRRARFRASQFGEVLHGLARKRSLRQCKFMREMSLTPISGK